MEIRCLIEVVSLIRIIQFVKGPEMGTVHDNDHTIVDCPITSLFFFLSWTAFLSVLEVLLHDFCFGEVMFYIYEVIMYSHNIGCSHVVPLIFFVSELFR